MEVVHVGGGVPPLEENAHLPDFNPERVHLLLQGVYGDYLHSNDGSHLDGGVADDAIWQRRWHQLAAQSAIWYTTPSGAVGHRFAAILTAEWRGVLGRSWNSEIPLVFSHVVLTKTSSVHRSKEIRARITSQMDLWERVLHVGLVVDDEAESHVG